MRLAAASLLFLVALSAFAQTPPCACCPNDDSHEPVQLPQLGKVVGTVTVDGDTLPGVTITIRDGARAATVVTTAEGGFTFYNVIPGDYRLHADLAGLTMKDKKHVVVREGAQTAVALRMHFDRAKMTCVDCTALDPPPPDGPTFTMTAKQFQALPVP